jgi:hypothetical protein
MDERGGSPSALHVLHGAGLLAVIAVAVALCGVGLQAFLGAGAAAVADQPVAAAPARPSVDPGSTYLLPAEVGLPDADREAAFLEAVRATGTGGFSSRQQILDYGTMACGLARNGFDEDAVAARLATRGEPLQQAHVVAVAAPMTLCPP